MPRCSELMPAAARVMMRDPLIWVGGQLIVIAVEVACGLGSGWNAVEPLCGVRHSACPEHQDKHHSAEKGRPAGHQQRRYQQSVEK